MTENAKRWAERIGRWTASGQSAEDFAKGEPFAASSLKWWSYRLRSAGGADANVRTKVAETATTITMARVVPNVRTASMGLVVDVGGSRIVIERGFDPQLLRDVVRALGVGQ